MKVQLNIFIIIWIVSINIRNAHNSMILNTSSDEPWNWHAEWYPSMHSKELRKVFVDECTISMELLMHNHKKITHLKTNNFNIDHDHDLHVIKDACWNEKNAYKDNGKSLMECTSLVICELFSEIDPFFRLSLSDHGKYPHELLHYGHFLTSVYPLIRVNPWLWVIWTISLTVTWGDFQVSLSHMAFLATISKSKLWHILNWAFLGYPDST